jgi:hypothetical protein
VAETTVKRLVCCGIRRTGKTWDVCINVGEGNVEKCPPPPGSKYHTFYVLYPFATYLLTLPRNYGIMWIL